MPSPYAVCVYIYIQRQRERERERERVMEGRKLANVQKHSKFLQRYFGLISIILAILPLGCKSFDYGEALSKSLLYFESQRSGRLPHNQRVTWRHHSGLTDGLEQGVTFIPLPQLPKAPNIYTHSSIGCCNRPAGDSFFGFCFSGRLGGRVL
jgi:hypothetical protein